MKLYRLELDEAGRSRLGEARSADPVPIDSGRFESPVSVNVLAETFQSPPELTVPRRPIDERFADLGVTVGGARWVSFSLPPGQNGHLHHTNTLDYQVVVAGEVTVGTEVDEVLLKPGDCVIIPGLEHSWSTGPEGCTLVGTVFGLAPA